MTCPRTACKGACGPVRHRSLRAGAQVFEAFFDLADGWEVRGQRTAPRALRGATCRETFGCGMTAHGAGHCSDRGR